MDHRWIFLVLERARVPQSLKRFLRGVYVDSITSVEHAGAARGQFAMMRGVRQGCPASGYLFTMAFDPVYSWLMSAVLPPEPHRPWFLHRCACAYADDFALAAASLGESLPTVADAFTTIETVTSRSLNHKKCHWIQYGNLAIPQFSEWVGTLVPVFRQMQIKDHARYLGVEIGPGAAAHRWTKARNTFVGVGARIRAFSQSLAQRLVSFKIYALSVLSFVGSVAEPEAATIAAENLALQRLSAGPFHSIPLRRKSTCGLTIDVDGIQLTSKAARFRVTSRSICCQQAWNASVLEKIILAEPLIPSPGAVMTLIFAHRLPTSLPPPLSWLAQWTVSET